METFFKCNDQPDIEFRIFPIMVGGLVGIRSAELVPTFITGSASPR